MQLTNMLRTVAVSAAVMTSAIAISTPAFAAEPVWQGPGTYHCPVTEADGSRTGWSVNVQPTGARGTAFNKPTYIITYDAAGYLRMQAKVNAECNPRPPQGF